LGPAEKYDTRRDLLEWMGEQFAKYGNIYRASIYGTWVYVISAPDLVEHVLLKNWQNYPKGQAIKRIAMLLGNGLMVSKGPLWTRQRRMIQPAFNRSALGALSRMIADANVELLARWIQAAKSNTKVNLTRDVSLMILEIVLKSIFGEDYPAVAPQLKVVSEEAARDLEFAHTLTSLGPIIVEVAELRRREARMAPDFLGMLMQARDRDSGEAMPDTLLSKEIMTLIVAGHETTASTLNWTWYLLSQNPDAENKLAAELDGWPGAGPPGVEELKLYPYTRNVIEEALRLYPPGWLMTRRAVQDDLMGGYFVPAGTEIYISPYYIQRHPGLWVAPERFDPDRYDAVGAPARPALAMLPFSAGPRNCIGEHLARMEMQIHLMMIGKHLRLRYLGEHPPTLAAGVNLLSARDLMMTPLLKATPPSRG
jgi:cytochrome P450